MVNFPPIQPTGNTTYTARTSPERRVVTSSAEAKREQKVLERRQMRDRRRRRGLKQIMDRRAGGTDRRRASIDLNV